MLAALVGNPFLFKVFDLSSVDSIYVGAGSVSADLYAKTKAAQPSWNLVTGYGNPVSGRIRRKNSALTKFRS